MSDHDGAVEQLGLLLQSTDIAGGCGGDPHTATVPPIHLRRPFTVDPTSSQREENAALLLRVQAAFDAISPALSALSTSSSPSVTTTISFASTTPQPAPAASPSVLRSQFQPVFEATRLPQFTQSALWRYLTDDWLPTAGSGTRYSSTHRLTRCRRLTLTRFMSKWQTLFAASAGDLPRLLFVMLKGAHPRAKHLSGDSFEPVLSDVLASHRELTFLAGNSVFQHRYTETVIAHIFFSLSRSLPPTDEDVLAGRCRGMTWKEFSGSDLVPILCRLPAMEINEERGYFSYKHFFVIYCKFYDLDTDNSLRMDADQLSHYSNGALTPIICERVCCGAGLPHQWRTRRRRRPTDCDGQIFCLTPYRCVGADDSATDSGVDLTAKNSADDAGSDDGLRERVPGSERRMGFLTYLDFVYFILAEEDRTSVAALEYWFRVVDLDEDGVVSLYELEHLWLHVEECLRAGHCNTFDFRDVICVAMDLTKPTGSGDRTLTGGDLRRPGLDPTRSLEMTVCIRMADLLRSRLTASRFFDYFINWHKLLERENTNGNRLLREIDERQQHYFLSLQFMPSPAVADEKLDKSNSSSSSSVNTSGAAASSPFALARIPTDGKAPWARWADLEYEGFMRLEEQEQRRQLELQLDEQQKQENDLIMSDNADYNHRHNDEEDEGDDHMQDDLADIDFDQARRRLAASTDDHQVGDLTPSSVTADRVTRQSALAGKRSRRYSPTRRSSKRDSVRVRGLGSRTWRPISGGGEEWEDDEAVADITEPTTPTIQPPPGLTKNGGTVVKQPQTAAAVTDARSMYRNRRRRRLDSIPDEDEDQELAEDFGISAAQQQHQNRGREMGLSSPVPARKSLSNTPTLSAVDNCHSILSAIGSPPHGTARQEHPAFVGRQYRQRSLSISPPRSVSAVTPPSAMAAVKCQVDANHDAVTDVD